MTGQRCDPCQFDDQFQPATRELMVFTKSKTRFFDLDAVREPPVIPKDVQDRWQAGTIPGPNTGVRGDDGQNHRHGGNPAGAPPLDWWLIPYTDPDVPQPGDSNMTATFYVGDAIETMNKLPEKSVDLVLSSPPFLALRSYLPADHPDKALEGGSQATPGEYVDWLLDVVEACARVLAPHGSLCFELGDTYSGSGGAGGDYAEDGLREGQPTFKANPGRDWPLAKSLSLIPETFRFAMVYGVNPHTGRRTAPWRLRNVIRWVRPNPPVGALGDKFRPATSELMVFCKAKDRYFDLDAVRNPDSGPYHPGIREWDRNDHNGISKAVQGAANPAGAPPLDWWNVPPTGYAGAHYAVWPPELLIKPIKAMCPEKVCRVCGEATRRIVEANYEPTDNRLANQLAPNGGRSEYGRGGQPTPIANRLRSNPTTLGFSDCGHDNYRPGLVLDPFAGSGTTLAVATGHGRDAIGIDLDERNYDLALDRVGPFILERQEI